MDSYFLSFSRLDALMNLKSSWSNFVISADPYIQFPSHQGHYVQLLSAHRLTGFLIYNLSILPCSTKEKETLELYLPCSRNNRDIGSSSYSGCGHSICPKVYRGPVLQVGRCRCLDLMWSQWPKIDNGVSRV